MKRTLTDKNSPAVDVKIWEKNGKFYWAYDYDGCPKNGPFKSINEAERDAIAYSYAIA